MSRVFWLQGRGARSLKEAKEALRLVPKDEPNAAHAEILASVAAERGDETTTQRELDRLGSLRVEEMHAELQGPYWASRASDLPWLGQYAQAYELASEALATIDGPETWLHMVDVAASAIETVADAVAAGLHEPRWIDRAVEWHARFDEYSGSAQRYVRLRASATADLSRARGTTTLTCGEQPSRPGPTLRTGVRNPNGGSPSRSLLSIRMTPRSRRCLRKSRTLLRSSGRCHS